MLVARDGCIYTDAEESPDDKVSLTIDGIFTETLKGRYHPLSFSGALIPTKWWPLQRREHQHLSR